MGSTQRDLKIILQGPDSMDTEEANDRAQSLRVELTELGVAVRQPRSAVPDPAYLGREPKGDLLEWGALVVSFTGGLPALIPLLMSWGRRNRNVRVILEADGERLELGDVTRDDAKAMAEEFGRRHSLESG